MVTDWPGHYPNGAASVAALVAAGADVNASFVGEHADTPPHWAARTDDVEVLDALLDAGANIDAEGGAVGDGSGTPLFDATVFGQWQAARRLVERGAATGPWEEVCLGLVDALAGRLGQGEPPDPAEVTAWWAGRLMVTSSSRPAHGVSLCSPTAAAAAGTALVTAASPPGCSRPGSRPCSWTC